MEPTATTAWLAAVGLAALLVVAVALVAAVPLPDAEAEIRTLELSGLVSVVVWVSDPPRRGTMPAGLS
jgi:hypothetical protein